MEHAREKETRLECTFLSEEERLLFLESTIVRILIIRGEIGRISLNLLSNNLIVIYAHEMDFVSQILKFSNFP